jgi:hypothetical protein
MCHFVRQKGTQMWNNRLQHRNSSSRIVLCPGSKNTIPCCQNQRRDDLKYFQAYKALDETHLEPLKKRRRTWSSKSPRNIQEDLQSYHRAINGPKWIFYSILLEIKTPCHTCEYHALQCTQMGNGT